MAGRRVENQRRQKYGTSSYVSGNTARKLAAAPWIDEKNVQIIDSNTLNSTLVWNWLKIFV